MSKITVLDYDGFPDAIKSAVDAVVTIYYDHGPDIASIKFEDISKDTNLTNDEIEVFGKIVRARLAQLGYLPIRNAPQ